MKEQNNKIITILGATASGKTSLASHLAYNINAEIISADSRQVYRKMTIGTGKDLDDYVVDGKNIPVHLIDIADPGYKYNVYEYHRDFLEAYSQIINNNRKVVMCGGSGMYLEAVLKSYRLIKVPVNKSLREELEIMGDINLQKLLDEMKTLHNVSDTSTRKRLIRAIEICDFYKNNPDEDTESQSFESVIFGVKFDLSIYL